ARSLLLPRVFLVEDAAGGIGVEPGLGGGGVFEVGVPEGGGEGEDGGGVVGGALAAFGGERAVGGNRALGGFRDEIILAAGGKGGEDGEPAGGVGVADGGFVLGAGHEQPWNRDVAERLGGRVAARGTGAHDDGRSDARVGEASAPEILLAADGLRGD